MNENAEQLLKALHEMVTDAWSVPLSAEKCVVDREKVLDMIEEILQSMPSEIKMAQEIVEKRNNYIDSGKREAENIKKLAEDQAKRLLNENDIMSEARRKANDVVSAAEKSSKELVKVAGDYCEDSMRRTEEALTKALEELRNSRVQFQRAIRERK